MMNLNVNIEAENEDQVIDKLYELVNEIEFTDNKKSSQEIQRSGVYYDLEVDNND